MAKLGRAKSGLTGGARRRARGMVGLLLLVGCVAVSGSAVAQPNGQAAKPVLRTNSPLGITDPAEGNGGGAYATFSLMYAPLLHLKADGKIVPGLATSWRFVKTKAGANKLFELTLRKNARFSTGRPITAQAVVAWLNHFVAKKGVNVSLLGPNPRFQARGRWTVRIQLTTPTALLPLYLTEWTAWGYVADVSDPEALKATPLGGGPYKVDPSRSLPGDHWTLVPNPFYYDKSAIHFSRVEIKLVTDQAMVQALQAKQFDITRSEGVLSGQAAAKVSSLRVVSAPFTVWQMQLDSRYGTSTPLENVLVRRAINYAIDRKAIAKAAYGKYSTPTSAYIVSDADADKFQTHYKYDPAQARSLLARAGYPNGFPLTLLLPVGQPANPLLQAAASYLEAVGIDMTIRLTTTYGADLFSHKYPAFLTGAAVGITPPSFSVFFHPGGALNFFGTDRQILDNYYAGLRAKDATPFWHKMYQRVYDQAYVVPLATGPVFYMSQKEFGGIELSAKRPFALPSEWFKK